MFKKLFTISLILALFASFSIAQNRAIIKASGEKIALDAKKNLREAIRVSGMKNATGLVAKPVFHTLDGIQTTGTLDTLSYPAMVGGAWNTNFGFFGQDVMFQYFEAPADMIIKAAGFSISDDEGTAQGGTNISIRLVKFNWTWDELTSIPVGTTGYYMGGYPSDGDGFNDIDYFGEEATGDWVDMSDGEYPTPPWAHDDYDLWSDGGFGWPIDAILQDGAANYQWVEMSNLGFEPEVQRGDIVAVVAVHNGVNLDADRIGFYSDNTIGIPAWKYYENGRNVTGPLGDPEEGDPGWWVRAYTWDMALAVDLVGDRPPVVVSVDELPTTLDHGPFTVNAVITDDNPSGGPAGVASATLHYTLDGGDVVDVAMSGTEPNFSAELPQGVPGNQYNYWVSAVDVGGLTGSQVGSYTFNIYQPSGVPTLVAFNGGDGTGYPEQYYFRKTELLEGYDEGKWDYDVWAYGALSEELVNNYTYIIEICLGGPLDYNREVIRTWLDGDVMRSYLLTGMEWLGADNGYVDQDYAEGDFEYDVLGVAHSYNDISYDGAGQGLPSLLFAQEGSDLGGALYDAFTASGTDSLQFDPVYEVGFANWMDAFDVVEGTNVDIMVETRGIGGVSDVQTLPAAAHKLYGSGNKVAFMAMDPISINSAPDYVWYGDSLAGFHYQAFIWFDPVVSVDEETIPREFSLGQNYPNPFNPSTKINYTIPKTSDVTLKVYNLLGQEVATLFDGVKSAGAHTVNFDASKLSSGVYFYTITTGDFVSTKKMMLIK